MSYGSGENMASICRIGPIRRLGTGCSSLALLYAASALPSQGFGVAVNVRTASYLERNAVAGVSGSQGILRTNGKDKCQHFKHDRASRELYGQK